MYENLATIAIFAFAFSLIAGRLERTFLTGPILFIFFGVVAGPVGFGVLDLDIEAVELRVLADLTLALVLFIDAANADLSVLKLNVKIPKRMLLIGLPMCIALGVGAGVLIFPEVPIFELCLLATMLAATDAALGKGVVTNKKVPARIREGLNAESGLNDGLCVPILFVFLALATGSQKSGGIALALELVIQEIGVGIAVAAVLTIIGANAIRWCSRRQWLTEIWQQIPVITIAIACFATAQSLHGSGYIAAFVGGLIFGFLGQEHTHRFVLASEGVSELLGLGTWIIFGAIVVGQAWLSMTIEVVVYSVLSLTVIRMLPVLLALTGTGERLESKMFLAWFGPRGLASIVFLIIVVSENLQAESILINTVVCTITLCVIAHGLTANFWANGLAGRLAQLEGNST